MKIEDSEFSAINQSFRFHWEQLQGFKFSSLIGRAKFKQLKPEGIIFPVFSFFLFCMVKSLGARSIIVQFHCVISEIV
jgi:hypothetical protein